MDRLYFDLETTGLNAFRDEIVLIAYALNDEDPQVEWFSDSSFSDFRTLAKRDSVKIGHNLNFDLLFSKVKGIAVNSKQLFDTLIYWHNNNPTMDCGLKDLGVDLLHEKVIELKDLAISDKEYNPVIHVKVGMDNTREWGYVLRTDLIKYAKHDITMTRDLHKIAISKSIPKYLTDIEFPLVNIIVNMEANGMQLDKEKIHTLLTEWGSSLKDLDIYFEKIKINPRSPKQIAEYLKK